LFGVQRINQAQKGRIHARISRDKLKPGSLARTNFHQAGQRPEAESPGSELKFDFRHTPQSDSGAGFDKAAGGADVAHLAAKEHPRIKGHHLGLAAAQKTTMPPPVSASW
jgi:hypothetical protein